MGDAQVDIQQITVLGKPRNKQKTAEKLHIHVNNIGNLQFGQNNTLLFVTSSNTEKENIHDDRQHGGDAEVKIVNENNVQLNKYSISGETILSIGDNCRLVEIKLNKDIQRKLVEKGEFKVTRGDKLVSVIWKNDDTMDNDSPTMTELKINFLKEDGQKYNTKELELEIFDIIAEENNVRLRKLITELLSTFKAKLEHIEVGCIQLVVSSESKDNARLLETQQEKLKDLLRRTIIPKSVNMDIVFRTKGEDKLKPVLESPSTQEPSLKDPQETKTQKTHDVDDKQDPQLEALTNPSPETKVEIGRIASMIRGMRNKARIERYKQIKESQSRKKTDPDIDERKRFDYDGEPKILKPESSVKSHWFIPEFESQKKTDPDIDDWKRYDYVGEPKILTPESSVKSDWSTSVSESRKKMDERLPLMKRDTQKQETTLKHLKQESESRRKRFPDIGGRLFMETERQELETKLKHQDKQESESRRKRFPDIDGRLFMETETQELETKLKHQDKQESESWRKRFSNFERIMLIETDTQEVETKLKHQDKQESESWRKRFSDFERIMLIETDTQEVETKLKHQDKQIVGDAVSFKSTKSDASTSRGTGSSVGEKESAQN